MTGSERKLPDTNVILRYLLGDEPQLYRKAYDFFEKVRVGTEKAIILESVLVECMYILTKFYHVPKEEGSDKLKSLLQYRGVINEDKRELIDALNIFAKGTIDFVDCILCSKARSTGHELLTFDEKLGKCVK